MIPGDILFVSENGISTGHDVKKLREIGADAGAHRRNSDESRA